MNRLLASVLFVGAALGALSQPHGNEWINYSRQ
jgi:hypothetical protein